jgi:hypothetical protein
MSFLYDVKRYFAEWTDVHPSVFNRAGVTAVCSDKRDIRQKGYSHIFPIYCVITHNTVVVSYSKRFKDIITSVTEAFEDGSDLEQVNAVLNRLHRGQVEHSIKFSFTTLPKGIGTSRAVQLKRSHYQDYLEFFKSQHAGSSAKGWLQNYFYSLADRGYSFGVFRDKKLVSATDAPDIPYMSHLIVEPGIGTLERYRRSGYAKIAVAAMLKYLLTNGKTPIWSCGVNNQASSELAQGLGFVRFADVVALSTDES